MRREATTLEESAFAYTSVSRDEIILLGETSGNFFIGWVELDGFRIYDAWLIVPPSPSQHAKNDQLIHYQYLLIRRSVSGYYFVSEGFHDHAGLIAYTTTAPLASRLSPSTTTNEEESEITSTVWITGSVRNYSL